MVTKEKDVHDMLWEHETLDVLTELGDVESKE
jgi:hypothetical protein